MPQRYEDVTIRLFLDDQEVGPIFATNVTTDTLVEHDKVKYQGAKIPQSDSHYNGETFSMNLEWNEGAADIEAMLDSFVAAIKNRSTTTGKVRMVLSGRIPGSDQLASYRYSGVQINLGMNASSGGRVQRALRGTADNRERI